MLSGKRIGFYERENQGKHVFLSGEQETASLREWCMI